MGAGQAQNRPRALCCASPQNWAASFHALNSRGLEAGGLGPEEREEDETRAVGAQPGVCRRGRGVMMAVPPPPFLRSAYSPSKAARPLQEPT